MAWPQRRQPRREGEQTAAIEWSDSEGLAWTTPLPGRGHSSPIVVENRIYLTTADESEQTQSLLVIEKQDGKLLAREGRPSWSVP